jgi:Protein of unknown function (DUF3341)
MPKIVLTSPEGITAAEAAEDHDGARRIYGLLADFDSPQALLDAAHSVREAGYRDVDAYTPFPIEEVSEALGYHGSKLPLIVFFGGALGFLTGYGMQRYSAVVDYPLNIGGRPLHSWPMFVPIAFELTILFAGISAVLGMFILNKLPMPYHPLFNAPRFALASHERYFLAIQATDPRFDREATRDFLQSLQPHEVTLVEI